MLTIMIIILYYDIGMVNDDHLLGLLSVCADTNVKKKLRYFNKLLIQTRWALSMLSLNGKKASELRETPLRVAIHSFLSA